MLARAHATLAAGCAFMTRATENGVGLKPGLPALSYTRMTGNRLRELDRFLSILIDEAALFLGGPGHDARSFARMRNTPNKFRLLEEMTGLRGGDDARLRAIGRISACLHHCQGNLHGQSMERDIRIAQGDIGNAIPSTDAAGRLRLASRTIISICDFYGGMGDSVVAEVLCQTSGLDFGRR